MFGFNRGRANSVEQLGPKGYVERLGLFLHLCLWSSAGRAAAAAATLSMAATHGREFELLEDCRLSFLEGLIWGFVKKGLQRFIFGCQSVLNFRFFLRGAIVS